jgi:hypothetical protein
MSHGSVPASVREDCLNCAASLSDGQKFCGACGQRTNIARQLTMRDIWHDLAHAITHADHSIFGLIRALATRPGHVAREYTEGKRKRHFGPFAFLIITVGLASAIIFVTGVKWFQHYGHGQAGELLQRHVNLVILLQTPLLALSCAALFWSARRSFADHLVLAAYTSGFHTLILAVIETPTFAMTSAESANPWLASFYFFAWFVYFMFAAAQFYPGSRWWAAGKAAVAVLLSQALTIALLMAFLYLTSSLIRS